MENVNEEAVTNTQQRIIDAALDLVSHVGYKSTTTKMIAQKAEVNETTIFKNFQSKQVLMDTAFKQHTKQITKEVDEFFSQSFNNTTDLMKQSGQFIAKIFDKHRQIVIGTIKEVGNEQTKTIFTYRQEYIQQKLCNKLKDCSNDRSLTDQQYETIVFIFNSAIMSLLVDKARKEYSDDEQSMTIQLDDVIELILKTVN
ncbi:TetR/AcrR family transcriptional regulator [Carnobacterium pleistocenium]|uniref:TetR/AcrR family transcriptional regulator n=1 Tax=Carnobacterium pleistocenium TaxID=181073 RepID=UPI000551249F|nr:TetR/AcrR family transcriptional regulator [Carnobacterium pleistocenium]